MHTTLLEGLVIKEQSGFFWVEVTNGTVYMCRLRGRLMEEAQSTDIAAIGDHVHIRVIGHDESGDVGVIESVDERDCVLARAARTSGQRGAGDFEREHIMIANADILFFVFAIAEPAPNFKMLDRFLVAGEQAEIKNLVIIVNKIDLEDPTNIEVKFHPYMKMGYPVLQTSAKDGRGIKAVCEMLHGKVSAFTGPSGVGKTSLLNRIKPGLARQVKQVSRYHAEGIHTTRDSTLIKLDDKPYYEATYIADTPGIRHLNVYDIEPEELDAYFIDIAAYVEACHFGDCTHNKEPGCAVRKAVEEKKISPRRYRSYGRLREELEKALMLRMY